MLERDIVRHERQHRPLDGNRLRVRAAGLPAADSRPRVLQRDQREICGAGGVVESFVQSDFPAVGYGDGDSLRVFVELYVWRGEGEEIFLILFFILRRGGGGGDGDDG